MSKKADPFEAIICFIPLSKMPAFKEEVLEELRSTGKKEVSEEDIEKAVRIVSDRWGERGDHQRPEDPRQRNLPQ